MNVTQTRSRVLLLLTCAATIATTGCWRAPGKPALNSGTPRPEQVTDFATLYGQNCAACHGAHGRDGAAIWLANPAYLEVAGVNNIQRVTANGVSGTLMPAFSKAAGGTLTDQQISILAQGMLSAWGTPTAMAGQTTPAYASSKTGDPEQGQKTFAVFCARCHGDDGTGAKTSNGAATGSLMDPTYLALISDQGLRSMILAGETEQGEHNWRSYRSGQPMSDEQITDVVAWLASHRSTTPGQVYKEQP